MPNTAKAQARRAELDAAVAAAHADLHDLIGQLQAKADSVDPDTADWGTVVQFNTYAERLREMLGLVG